MTQMTTPNSNLAATPIHIMLDLETTGLSANAGIVQIGAVRFSPYESPHGLDRIFNYRISCADNEAKGYEVDPATMAWWDKQESSVRQRVFSGNDSAKNALQLFIDWCSKQSNGHLQNIYIWSNHIDFDLPVLKNALYKEHHYYPFDFRKHSDYATLKALCSHITLERSATLEAHDAAADAIYQSLHCMQILEYLKNNGVISNAFHPLP